MKTHMLHPTEEKQRAFESAGELSQPGSIGDSYCEITIWEVLLIVSVVAGINGMDKGNG